MKLLGIDYGRKRLGLAICGALKIASPLDMVERSVLEKDLAALRHVIEDNEIEKIVVSYPKNMNNTIGEMAEEAQAFAQMLEKKLLLPTVLWDERLTSAQADRAMLEGGLTRNKRKQNRDQIAATLLLQNYVDCHKE